MTQPDQSAARGATAVLLLAGGLTALIGTFVDQPAVTAAAVAVAAAAVLGLLLALVSRPAAQLAVATVVFGITAWALRGLDARTATVAVPAAGAAALMWAALAWGRGGPLRLALPAAAATIATWYVHGRSVPVGAMPVLPGALLVAEVLGWLISIAYRHRRVATAALADVDAFLLADLDLRGAVDIATAGSRICRVGTELLDGRGALLYVQGPGRLLPAGAHGDHPAPMNPELGRDHALEDTLRIGTVRRAEDRVLVPVTGVAGVIGVLDVHGAQRALDDLTAGMAQLFGSHVGCVLDRLHAVESLFDAATRDPVTGVGNRHQAAGIVASLRPGDGLLLLEIDALDSLRRAQGEDAANVVLGQIGLHLRNGTRTGDAVARYGDNQFIITLRDLKAPIDMVVDRLVGSWLACRPTRTFSVGGALHVEGDAPMDTVERAEAALASALRRGGAQGHVAPDWNTLASA